MQTARTVLNEQGMQNAKIGRIATEAGLVRGNVYYYFANLEEILWELSQQLGEDISDYLDHLESNQLDRAGRLQSAKDWLAIVWHWRFIYLESQQLYRTDDRIRTMMLALQDRSIAIQSSALISYLMSLGLNVSAHEKQICHDIAVNGALVSSYWLYQVSLRQDISKTNQSEFLATAEQFLSTGYSLYNRTFLRKILNAH